MATPATKPKMPYVRLGKSGLKVSRIILGCMQYGSSDWQQWVLGEDEAIQHIKTAYDAGIQTFDTADVYSNGLSEVILGKAIQKLQLPRNEIVVMTKHIFQAVKASLDRLGLDYVDLLQCHRFDPDTPIEETMQALHDVVKAGYVRYIGMSSCWAWQFHVMQNYAINNNLTPFVSMQNHYNLLYREEEREMFPTLKHFGVGSIPWSPLARGVLCRPFQLAPDNPTVRATSDLFGKMYGTGEDVQEILKRVEVTAQKRNISMAQVAIAWMLSKDSVSAPIVGTTSLKNLEDMIAAVHVHLSDEEIKYLEEPYKPRAISGHA